MLEQGLSDSQVDEPSSPARTPLEAILQPRKLGVEVDSVAEGTKAVRQRQPVESTQLADHYGVVLFQQLLGRKVWATRQHLFVQLLDHLVLAQAVSSF